MNVIRTPDRLATALRAFRFTPRGRAIHDGLVVAALLGAPAMALTIGLGGGGVDYAAYWPIDLGHLYGETVGQHAAHLYAPAFFQVIAPLSHLPYHAFVTLWALFSLAALAWMVGPALLVPALVLFPFTAWEVSQGNIDLLLAAAVVLGFRFPAAWAFVVLTKITPGVGLLWFAVRREWKSLGVALGAILAISAVSYLLGPALWPAWTRVLVTSGGGPASGGIPVPLPVRLAAAIGVIVWGARTDRRWTMAVATTLALPVLWPFALAMLIGVVPLLRPASARPISLLGSAGSASMASREPSV